MQTEDKSSQIRNYILSQLEDGVLKSGDKLPGARELVTALKSSLVTVQSVIETLVSEGILETVPRRGTFVRKHWEQRILRRNLVLFRSQFPWLTEFKEIIGREFPELLVSQKFDHGMFEIRNTFYVQVHHDEYMDLTELFSECFPDRSELTMAPFEAFKVGNKLVGVPIIYSPRVMLYNPRLLTQAGCILPRAGWSWDDFMDCVRQLREIMPGRNVFQWNSSVWLWMSWIVRAGGCLIDSNAEDMVKIDSPETRRGLKLYQKLKHELRMESSSWGSRIFVNDFIKGEAAMLIGAREQVSRFQEAGFNEWEAVPLPLIEGGCDLNVQATDLLCIRRECVEHNLAARLVKAMLSENIQSMMADWKYGIPIRKSAMVRSIDYSNRRDAVFLGEIPKMYAQYNLDSVELFKLVWMGIENILEEDEDIDESTAQLANMVRTYFKIKNHKRRSCS